jgi:hypothetical protein
MRKPHISLANTWLFAINTTEDEAEYLALKNTFRYFGYDPDLLLKCEGVYQGGVEQSYLYPACRHAAQLIVGLAEQHKQHSVLFINATNNASLLYIKDRTLEEIGVAHFTTPGRITSDYTRIDEDYFVVD